MNISQLLRNYFAADVRGRAGPYAFGGATRILQGNFFGVWATVHGSSTYNVAISLEDDALHMTCTCPYFADRGDGCKHLWAVAQTAELKGYLSELLQEPYFEVIFDDEESLDGHPRELAELDPDDDEGDWPVPAPRRTVAYKPKKRKAPKKERSADWLRVFNQIKLVFDTAISHLLHVQRLMISQNGRGTTRRLRWRL